MGNLETSGRRGGEALRKLVPALGMVAVLGLLGLVLIGASSGESTAGRYQLFQGRYQFINVKGEEYWSEALFKIDTSTGELFVCSSSQVTGRHLGKPGVVVQRTGCQPFAGEIEMPE